MGSGFVCSKAMSVLQTLHLHDNVSDVMELSCILRYLRVNRTIRYKVATNAKITDMSISRTYNIMIALNHYIMANRTRRNIPERTHNAVITL